MPFLAEVLRETKVRAYPISGRMHLMY